MPTAATSYAPASKAYTTYATLDTAMWVTEQALLLQASIQTIHLAQLVLD